MVQILKPASPATKKVIILMFLNSKMGKFEGSNPRRKRT